MRQPWNKGKAVGAKKPLSHEQIQLLRGLLTAREQTRDLALFETALSTLLRGSDVLSLKVSDVLDGLGAMRQEIMVVMDKTNKPIKAPLTERARAALAALIEEKRLGQPHYLFAAHRSPYGQQLSTEAYRQIVKGWARMIHSDPAQFGTHSLRRTRAAIIYAQTRDVEAVRQLLGHANISTTQRYLGVSADHALELSRRFEV